MAERGAVPRPNPRANARGSQGHPAFNLWGGDAPVDRGGGRASALARHPGERWANLLSIVVGTGLGITISGTRDGGALALTLFTADGPSKRYAANPEELDALLDALQDYCGDLV